MDATKLTIRCWRISEWPAEDQCLWAENCAPGDPFDGPRYGAELRQATRDKAAKGYGRWLWFLASRNLLDPSVAPLERVTKQRMRQYFLDLRTAENADHTIIGRFDELARAIRILSAGQDTSWIRKPGGVSLHSLLERRKRTLIVPDIDVLLDWGFSIMDNAADQSTERQRLTSFRDGLLIAMLASCGRRLRSISLLRVGHEIVRCAECYRIELSASQVKTKKADSFNLQGSLTPYIERYLSHVRPLLLAGTTLREFWISASGEPWTSKALQGQVLVRSRERFGTAFGPHRFRHSIATTLPHLDPSHPSLAAELLGISNYTVQDSYNRAQQTQAASSYQAIIDRRIATLQASAALQCQGGG